MTFKVYSGPAGADAVSPIHKDRMLFKEFPNFDEALSWASHIKDTGRVAVLIEDETGRTLDKREIAAALADRNARDMRGVRHNADRCVAWGGKLRERTATPYSLAS